MQFSLFGQSADNYLLVDKYICMLLNKLQSKWNFKIDLQFTLLGQSADN